MPLVQHIKIHEAARDTAHDAPPYAKLDPSPSDIRMAAERISLILSVAEIDCARVIEQLDVNIDKAALLKDLHGHLADCNADVTVPIERASEELDEGRYEGNSLRGPFYRAR